MQAAVLETAAAAEARGWEMSAAEADAKTAIMAENGMIIVEPSEALTAGLQEIGAQMLTNWEASASESALSILSTYQQ